LILFGFFLKGLILENYATESLKTRNLNGLFWQPFSYPLLS